MAEQIGNFGLAGISLKDIQKAIEENPVIESNVEEIEQVIEITPQIDNKVADVPRNTEKGRAYLIIDIKPDGAQVVVKDLNGKIIKSDSEGKYDVAEGAYSLDFYAEGYMPLKTSVIVSSFDTTQGYMHLTIDLELLVPAEKIIVENQLEEEIEETGSIIDSENKNEEE